MGSQIRGYKISNAQPKRRGRGTQSGEKRGPYRRPRRRSFKTSQDHWRVAIFVWVRHFASVSDLLSDRMRCGCNVDWKEMAHAWKRVYGEAVRPATLEQRYRRAVKDPDLQPCWNLVQGLSLCVLMASGYEHLLSLKSMLRFANWEYSRCLAGESITEWREVLEKLGAWPGVAQGKEKLVHSLTEIAAHKRPLPRAIEALLLQLVGGQLPNGTPAEYLKWSAELARAYVELTPPSVISCPDPTRIRVRVRTSGDKSVLTIFLDSADAARECGPAEAVTLVGPAEIPAWFAGTHGPGEVEALMTPAEIPVFIPEARGWLMEVLSSITRGSPSRRARASSLRQQVQPSAGLGLPTPAQTNLVALVYSLLSSSHSSRTRGSSGIAEMIPLAVDVLPDAWVKRQGGSTSHSNGELVSPKPLP